MALLKAKMTGIHYAVESVEDLEMMMVTKSAAGLGKLMPSSTVVMMVLLWVGQLSRLNSEIYQFSALPHLPHSKLVL